MAPLLKKDSGVTTFTLSKPQKLTDMTTNKTYRWRPADGLGNDNIWWEQE
jgi:hypothetical protein